MIFIDSNIPMYLIGAPHAHKVDAQRLLEKFVADRQRLVTDAEVFEEILHRNAAINSRDAIQPAFDACSALSIKCYQLIWPSWSMRNRLS